jgi:hypothetical protein
VLNCLAFAVTMSIPRAQLEQLKMFVSVLKQKPDLLHTSELAFFKDYLEAMGATLPEKKEEQKKEETKEDEKAEPMEAEAEPEADPESEESEVELDMEGVIGEHCDDMITSIRSGTMLKNTNILAGMPGHRG